MLSKLNQMAIAAYLTVTGYAKDLADDLKNDERGLSGVVVAVLLILVAVLAVVMLWGSLKEFLSSIWEKVTGQGNSIQGGTNF